MTNNNSSGFTVEMLEDAIFGALLKGETVAIPDFGYLEVKSLSDRKTILFKPNPQESGFDLVREKSEKSENDLEAAIRDFISHPLAEGQVVSLPKLGIFRPIKRNEGSFRVLFTPSALLREQLGGRRSEAKPLVSREVKNRIPLLKKDEDFREENVSTSNEEENVETVVETVSEGSPNTRKYAHRSSRNTAQVGDVIVPPDETVSPKGRNVVGWMLAAAVCIAFIVIILTNIFSKSKPEEQPVSVTKSESINLPALAGQHYGNPAFWVYIYKANAEKLTSPVNIPRGISITIPDLAEYGVDKRDSMDIKQANLEAEKILKQINN
jgi:nucleoid DNA-binding protein